jgi:hypothetical protein
LEFVRLGGGIGVRPVDELMPKIAADWDGVKENCFLARGGGGIIGWIRSLDTDILERESSVLTLERAMGSLPY